ncbi:MAG: cysteine-rich repeat protein [Polyangiales bacterium]
MEGELMNRIMKLLIMGSLVFGVACGDDDTLPTLDAGTLDGAMPDVPTRDVPMVDGGDPCTGVAPADRCGTAGTTCSGDTLTTCAANANGCLVTTEADCSADGGTCDDSGAVAMCSSDPCMGITNCDGDERSCDGDTLSVCALDAMGCSVLTETDCSADATTCDDTGAMAVCVDECDGITDCDAEGRSCDGDTLNVCAPDAAGCLVNTPTDCAGESALCDATVDPIACVPLACPAATTFAMALDCDSGTITGNTMGGTTDLDEICGFGSYASPENVFTFSDARSATVSIVATRTSATGDADLLVIDGGAGGTNSCATSSCLDSSRGFAAEEEVEFDLVTGNTAYVAYAVFSTGAPVEVEYELTVSCTISTCGDSAIDGPEQCDDGNADATDGCDAVCQIEPGYVCTEDGAGLSSCALSCGDSEVNGEDECDDGNMTAMDGCSDTCTIEEGYVCEEDGAGLSSCEIGCGNGNVDGDDECDDANTTAGDGCSDTCTIEAGYVCDETAGLSACELSCGDGDLNGDDECDDDNTTAGDGCSATCEIEADFACYDEPSICVASLASFMGEIEDTDTEWVRPNANCTPGSRTNRFEPFTYMNTTAAGQFVDILAMYDFDGYVHVYTGAVDPANTAAGCVGGDDDFNGAGGSFLEAVPVPAGSSITIVVSSFGSQPSAPDNTFRVDVLASMYADCGDSSIDGLEACDDGANVDGDGCSDVCTVEAGFGCAGEPSTCEPSVCGNSMVEFGEVCDDGNLVGGDDCEADCRSAVFTGDLENTDDTWERPSAGCGSGSAGKFYDVVPFTWGGTTDETLVFTVAWDGVDGYVHTFSDPFDAATAPTGCIDGGDDFGGVSGSQAEALMTPATTVNVIMSTFSSADTGGWTLTVTR